MIPQFAYCATMLHHDIRTAVPLGWIEDLDPHLDPEWEDKVRLLLLLTVIQSLMSVL